MIDRRTSEVDSVDEEAIEPLVERLMRNRSGILLAAALTVAAAAVLIASLRG
jgi:hypothetical protein